jgi:hypothetical protein
VFLKEVSVKAIKAVIDNGQIVTEEPLDAIGRQNAIVIVLDVDPWQALMSDPRPRPELDKLAEEAHQEYLQGKTTPIDPDTML